MKNKVNNYMVLNNLQVNLPDTRGQKSFHNMYFFNWNHTLSGKQFQNMIHNSFPELLTKTPTKDISTGFMKQQYENVFCTF